MKHLEPIDLEKLGRLAASASTGICFGTGYLIAPKLILTARHSIDPAWPTGGAVTPRSSISFGSAERPPSPLDSARVHVPSNPSLDVALIEVDNLPVTVHSTPPRPILVERLNGRSEQEAMAWGYPMLTRSDVTQHASRHWLPVPLAGCLLHGSERASRLWFESSSGNPEVYWTGLSGAPVFLSKKSKLSLVGHVGSCYRNGSGQERPFEGRRLSIIPVGVWVNDVTLRNILRRHRPTLEDRRMEVARRGREMLVEEHASQVDFDTKYDAWMNQVSELADETIYSEWLDRPRQAHLRRDRLKFLVRLLEGL